MSSRHSVRVAAGAAVVALGLAGCGGGGPGASAGRGRAPHSRWDCVVGVNIRAGETVTVPASARRACRGGGHATRMMLPPARRGGEQARAGRDIAITAGCAACHRLGPAGNDGPGPALTRIADRLPPPAIRRALVAPAAPMPSYRALGAAHLDALTAYLAQLGGP